jgi:hypothetical protein
MILKMNLHYFPAQYSPTVIIEAHFLLCKAQTGCLLHEQYFIRHTLLIPSLRLTELLVRGDLNVHLIRDSCLRTAESISSIFIKYC